MFRRFPPSVHIAAMAPLNVSPNVEIVNIHRNNIEDTLAKNIYDGLGKLNGEQKSLPTLLLYNTEGLRLFEKITYLEEYYLTEAEIEVLTTHAAEIVKQIPEDTHLVELGSGYACSRSSSLVNYIHFYKANH